jgi:hypothetical protein
MPECIRAYVEAFHLPVGVQVATVPVLVRLKLLVDMFRKVSYTGARDIYPYVFVVLAQAPCYGFAIGPVIVYSVRYNVAVMRENYVLKQLRSG